MRPSSPPPTFFVATRYLVPTLVLRREVTDESSPLYGQLEVYFRRRCEKGTMIPWAGELVLQGETPSKYGESQYLL